MKSDCKKRHDKPIVYEACQVILKNGLPLVFLVGLSLLDGKEDFFLVGNGKKND